jgi:hypothetical protein
MSYSSVSDPENPRKQQARGDLRSVTAAPGRHLSNFKVTSFEQTKRCLAPKPKLTCLSKSLDSVSVNARGLAITRLCSRYFVLAPR